MRMIFLKERDYWLSVGLFFLFAGYQVFAIWVYYSRQFTGEAPHRVVQMIADNVAGDFYVAVLFQILLILLIHALVATVAYVLWKNIPSARLKASRVYMVIYILGVFLLSVLWNRILFPASISFETSDLLLLQTHSMNVFYALNLAYAIFFITSLISFVRNKRKSLHHRTKRVYVIMTGFLAVVLLLNVNSNYLDATTEGANKAPNIILIGVDSLRLDHLAYYGFKKGLTPNIDGFIEQAAVFEDTLTPIARTFPAWMSILSGKYPSTHGGRFNLYPKEKVEKSNLLSFVLQKQNYATYYMTDEVRFANFTKEYGFDVLSAPEMGVLDFTFGMSLDFVYLNLLSRIKHFNDLFPYTYANRAAKTIYYPQSFSDRATATVNRIDEAPFFMAAHHCLPHWPYYNHLDSDVVEKEVKKYKSKSTAPLQYLNTLYLTDKQVGNLLTKLKDKGALENSIVIMLSDHGESFGTNKDMFISENDINIPLGAGHGTFALSSIQHKVLFAIQQYKNGRAVWQPGKRMSEASLIDIAPTVMDSLSLDIIGYDGISLLPYLEDRHLVGESRMRFIESGLTSGTIDSEDPDEAKLFKEYSSFYKITDNNLVELRPESLSQLLMTKQRAVTFNGKGLMFRRVQDGEQWLLADYKTQTLREIDTPDSYSKNTKVLKANLCVAYRADADFYNDFCAAPLASN